MLIDAHLHAVRRRGLPRNAAGANFATPEELIAIMERTGVDRGVLLPNPSPECSFQVLTTEETLEICETYPDRFFPFCNVDPRAGTNAANADLSFHLEYYKSRGCRGVGEITANLEIGDPLVQNLLRHCERCELPALFHLAPRRGGGYGLIDALGLPGLAAALAAFPRLAFIGHSQPFWAEISGDLSAETRGGYPTGPVRPGGALPRLLERHPNLYCGWDAYSGYNALARDPEFCWGFMERFNERILFGTDICSPSDNHRHVEFLRAARDAGRISEAAFEHIAWRNANRLLQLGLPDPPRRPAP